MPAKKKTRNRKPGVRVFVTKLLQDGKLNHLDICAQVLKTFPDSKMTPAKVNWYDWALRNKRIPRVAA